MNCSFLTVFYAHVERVYQYDNLYLKQYLDELITYFEKLVMH